jgi:hypothetical protein
VPTPVDRTTPTTTYFRAEAQGRRVNTFIKRHPPAKNALHCKKLRASAPLREITVPTPVNRTTLSMTYFRAEAQGRRVNTFIKGHLPLKMLFIAKSSAPQRLCARSQCLRQLTALPPPLRIFAQRRRGAESYSGRPCTQRVIPVFITSPPKFNKYPSLLPVSRR